MQDDDQVELEIPLRIEIRTAILALYDKCSQFFK